MNDESTIAAASSYVSRGYSYVASNTKWVIVVMAAAFVVFFSIGIGLGYGPIGNSIYGNDDASSVSSAMAVDFAASDHGDKSDGGAKSGKSKSDKSSGAKAGKATQPPTSSPSSSPTGSPTQAPSSSPTGSPTMEVRVFDESFVAGQLVSATAKQAWDNYLASLTGTYNQVTISGSLDPTGVTCVDFSAVNQLANALNTNAAVSVQCNGRTWNTGFCQVSGIGLQIELNSNPLGNTNICSCSNPGYIVRPKIGNQNWGGIDGPTCNAASQTIRVEFS